MAMVIDELTKAILKLPFFNSRGISAIANTITTGTRKKDGLFLKKSVRCGMYKSVYMVVNTKLKTKKTVNRLANRFIFAKSRCSVFMARKIAPCIMKRNKVVNDTMMAKGEKKYHNSPVNSC